MKKCIMFFAFCICNALLVFGQEEYMFLFSGTVSGLVRVQKDSGGRITITPSIQEWGEVWWEIAISNTLSPILPQSYWVSKKTREITINSNTTMETTLDGGWTRTVVDGNTTTKTSSDGSWTRTVVDGNTTIETSSDGSWSRTFIDGNTIMTTYSNGTWSRTVVEGNRTTITYKSALQGESKSEYVINGNNITAYGYAYRTGAIRTVNGNIITIVSTRDNELLLRVEKQGHNIFIHAGKVSWITYDDDNTWVDINNCLT